MTYGKKTNVGAKKDSFFAEVMAFLLLTSICVSTFWQGLLFETASMPMVIIVSMLSGVVIIKALAGGGGVRLDLPAVAFLILAIGAAISLTNAASLRDAAYALSRNCCLCLVALAAGSLKREIPLVDWLRRAFLITGCVIAVLGLDALWGGYLAGAINQALNGGVPPDAGQGFLFSL
jgi:hypothetical protein